MIILHPFTPSPAYAAAQQPAWFQWFALSASDFDSVDGRERLPPIFHVPTVEPTDYEDLLKRFWDTDFILIEHDIIPTRRQILDLVNCPHPLCTVATRLWPGKTGLSVPKWGARVRTADSEWHWIEEGMDSADHVTFGFCKFTAAGVNGVRPYFGKGDWKDIDLRVCQTLNRDKPRETGDTSPLWHVHWPEALHIPRWK